MANVISPDRRHRPTPHRQMAGPIAAFHDTCQSRYVVPRGWEGGNARDLACFDGLPVRLFEVRFALSDHTIRLWCLPGGSAPEWPLQFVSRPSAALFVADAQQSMRERNCEFWRAVSGVVELDRWFVVLTKCDLADSDEQAQALPLELESRPVLRIGSYDAQKVSEPARAFLTGTVFTSVAPGG